MKKTITYIIGVAAIIVTGTALSFGWNTFVLRIFELPKISIWTAIALTQMYELIKWEYKDTPNLSDDDWLRRAVVELAVSLLAFASLYLFSLI